jgi:hypothetical protein
MNTQIKEKCIHHSKDIGIDGRNNIRIDLKETGWECVAWLHLAQDRDQLHTCEHGNEPSGSIKGR